MGIYKFHYYLTDGDPTKYTIEIEADSLKEALASFTDETVDINGYSCEIENIDVPKPPLS